MVKYKSSLIITQSSISTRICMNCSVSDCCCNSNDKNNANWNDGNNNDIDNTIYDDSN